MQIFRQENEFFMSFSSFFYKYTICQRSFDASFSAASALSFHPYPCRAQLFIDLLFFLICISSSFLSPLIIESFSIHFRDHLAIILNVTIGYLSFFFSLVLFTWSFLILKKTEHKTIRHWIVQCLTDKYCCALR